MTREINEKPSEEKFISGTVVYPPRRQNGQTDRAVLTPISQPTRHNNNEGIRRSEGTSKALSIRNRVRDEGEEIVSPFCCFSLRTGTRQGGHQIWIGKNHVLKRKVRTVVKYLDLI